jgi:hypothetical protein
MSTTAERLNALIKENPSQGFVGDAYATIKNNLATMISGDPRIKAQIAEQSMSTAERLNSVAARANIPAENQIETPGIAFGTGFTDTIPFAVGLGFVSQAIPQARAASGAGRVVSGLQNMLSQYGRVFKQNPVMMTTGEAFAGGTGGFTGFELERRYPDLPGARFIGEVAGGFGADLAPRAIKMLPSYKIYNAAKEKFSPAKDKVQARAAELLSIGDREGALKALQEARDFSPNAQFTASFKTDDPTYSRMEQTILKGSSDGELSERFAQMIEDTNNAIRDDLSFGGSSAEEVQSLFQNQISHFRNLLDARLQIAGNRADKQISKIRVTDLKENIEPIVRSQLSDALKEARAFEDQLYKAINQKEIVDINISKIARLELAQSLPAAQKQDMPSAARFLDPKSPSYLGKKKVKGKTEITNQNTIFELRGVQSQLRTEARMARAGDSPNFNKARIADELADSITEDLANIYAEPGSENPIATAIAFSRELNDRFGKGSVAKILKRERRGGDSIDSSKTLSATLGTGKVLDRVAYDNILQAVSGNPEVQNAMEDFIKFKFFKGEEFNPRQAQEFLNSNSDLMNRMPTLKSEVQNAIRTNDSRLLTESKTKKGTPFLDPKINKAIIYMNQGTDQAFKSVLGSNNPAREMKTLIKMTSRDNTGEALQGLKTGFTDYLFNQSVANTRLPTGQSKKIIDGTKFNEAVQDPKTKQAIISLFSKEERARIERAARTAQALSQQVMGRPTIELAQQEGLNIMQKALLRISGGTLGRRLGTGTLQAPEQLANIFETLGKGGVFDAEVKLLEDAIFNDDLFKVLLEKPTKGEISKQSQTVLRAWMAKTLATHGDENSNQQEQQ